MAVAVYTSDLSAITTDPDSGEAVGNWAALGGGASGLNLETDYFIQGINCISKNAFASSTKGMVEDTTLTLFTNGASAAVYLWVTHATPGSLDTKANGGIRIELGSAAGTLNSYYYAGSDTIDYGAPWICAVVDPDAATQATGAVAASAIDHYGAQAKLIGGPTKGAPFGIDTVREGRSYDVTAGDAGAPATFTAAAAKNDLQANRYGQFQRVPGVDGSYTMQCRLGLGTAVTACYFSDANASIILNSLEHVASDFLLFEIINAGTVVIWDNITVSRVTGGLSSGDFTVTSSSSVALTSCTFNDLGLFVLDANTTSTGSTYRRCDKITTGGATIVGGKIDKSVNAIALTASSPANAALISRTEFISNGTGNGLEITGTVADITLSDLDFSGYSLTVDADKAIYVNIATGSMTINISGGSGVTASSHVRTAGATVTVSANTTVTFDKLKDNTEVRVFLTGTQTEVAGIEDATTGTIDNRSFSWALAATTVVDYQLISKQYKIVRVEGYTVPATNTTIDIQQQLDLNY